MFVDELVSIWEAVYDDSGSAEGGAEGGAGEGGAEGGSGESGSSETGGNETGNTGSDVDLSGITLDKEQQKKLNILIKKEKEKATNKSKKEIEKTITQLKETQKLKGLSDQEKEQLEQRIETMQKSLLTKEQLAAEEKKKLQNQHQTELQKVATDRDQWRNLYTTSTIERAIIDASHQHEAFDPEHIIALLKPVTSLEPDENDAAVLVPKVKFRDTNSEGKQVTLDLTVPAAVKRMTEIERHFPLFKTTAKSGLGLTKDQQIPGNLTSDKVKDLETYKKNRQRVLNG